MTTPISIAHVGLVTSVGLTTATTCAALRAKVTNPTPTRFMGVDGEWITAHQVDLGDESTGLEKIVAMAKLAIVECLEQLPVAPQQTPLLLCIPDAERPGRLDGLDRHTFGALSKALGVTFHPRLSGVLAGGRTGVLLALDHARRLLAEEDVPQVLIAASDSLIVWHTLTVYGDQGRLLSEHNSNGFIPGEAAGAIVVSRPHDGADELLCMGIGHGVEPSPFGSGEPLRAEGMTSAIKAALQDSGCEMHQLDFRITDISGEQYFFREAALAFARTVRQPKEEFDLWHPAEGIGETGAAAGAAMIGWGLMACRKGYARGRRILLHCSDDGRGRAAAVMLWTGR
jgi:3-oxoacyl-[acyl-carrier-protein] synthase I